MQRRRRPTADRSREFEASGRLVLACRGCDERVVLLGREDDWYREGRLSFRCSGCGERVTLADRVVDGVG